MDGFFTTRTIIICPEKLLSGWNVAQFLNRKSLLVERVPADAKQLVRTAHAKSPVLIIFSDEIQGMSPEELVEVIRRDPSLKNTQLLLLTEQIGDDFDSETPLDVDARLVAPVVEEQVVETIGAMLDVGVRRGPRVSVEILASLEGLGEDDMDGATTVVNILNLGQTGILVESPFHLKIGAVGNVRFRLPGGDMIISTKCAVKMMADELRLQYGLEFGGISDAEQSAIVSYIKEQEEG